MDTNLTRYKSDLEQLIQQGELMSAELSCRDPSLAPIDTKLKAVLKTLERELENKYQSWYSEAFSVLKQLLPDRIAEFEHLYKGDGKRKDVTVLTYTIQDWLMGVRAAADITAKKAFDDLAAVSMRLSNQVAILKSAERRFESTLFDIRQLVQADIFDSELDAATELAAKGFTRAAGAIAGVVLEKHLGQVATNHSLQSRKKHATISDLNDILKKANVLDVPGWRQIQRLGDIRNLCDHSKERDPTSQEISEMIAGVERLTKTLY